MNELNTLELDDQELMGVVGGGCQRDYCKPRCCGGLEVDIDVSVVICL
jgi:hypothetical protein